MANYDEKTGIHYGVISPNNISSETLSELCDKSTDTIYESAKKELLDDFNSFCDDHNIEMDMVNTDSLIDEFNNHYENDYHGYEYEDKDYILHISDDNFGIFVIKSPYYTYTKQCSPCAPGAGDLNAPITKKEYEDHHTADIFMFGTVKAYCLPIEFFDEYNEIPYKYYNVSDDKEVILS